MNPNSVSPQREGRGREKAPSFLKPRLREWQFVFPLTCAAITFLLLRHVFELSPSLTELIVLPLFLWTCASIRVVSVSIPRSLIWLTFFCGMLSVWLVESSDSTQRGNFYLSMISGDEREIESRLMRENINKFLEQSDIKLRALRHPRSFSDPKEISDFLEQKRILVWGDKEWLKISFPVQKPIQLGEITPVLPPSVARLKLVRSIPNATISYQPSNYTAQFLAMLLVGVSSDRFATSDYIRKQFLTDAYSFVAFWVGYKHRAFAAWELGNQELLDALRHPEAAVLACAISSYKRAVKLVASWEDPVLYSAILNNLAVAERLNQSLYFAEYPKGRFRELFSRAAGLARLLPRNQRKSGPWKVAKANLRAGKQKIGQKISQKVGKTKPHKANAQTKKANKPKGLPGKTKRRENFARQP